MELERKQGVSNLELMCEELLEEERLREQKRELKREKRKKRRAKIQLSEVDSPPLTKQISSECKVRAYFLLVLYKKYIEIY